VSELQEIYDRHYWSNGPSCAGCDWWRGYNSRVGECRKAAPVPSHERASMFGVSGCSMNIGAGHPFTPLDHHCGDFKDEFDWSSLTSWYRRKVGALLPPVATAPQPDNGQLSQQNQSPPLPKEPGR
jgi:hypothetical protein